MDGGGGGGRVKGACLARGTALQARGCGGVGQPWNCAPQRRPPCKAARRTARVGRLLAAPRLKQAASRGVDGEDVPARGEEGRERDPKSSVRGRLARWPAGGGDRPKRGGGRAHAPVRVACGHAAPWVGALDGRIVGEGVAAAALGHACEGRRHVGRSGRECGDAVCMCPPRKSANAHRRGCQGPRTHLP